LLHALQTLRHRRPRFVVVFDLDARAGDCLDLLASRRIANHTFGAIKDDLRRPFPGSPAALSLKLESQLTGVGRLKHPDHFHLFCFFAATFLDCHPTTPAAKARLRHARR
jgi:hypothetical protein